MLDLTRLMRRAGRVLTGVDRVELAYLRAVLDDPTPVFGLIRTRLGYILLDQSGMKELRGTLSAPTPNCDADELNKRALKMARKASIGRVPPSFLARMLRRHLPHRTAYLNVGHSNLTERVLTTLKFALDARITVFVHDVIPLEHPEFQREGAVEPFARMIDRVGQYADVIVFNSFDTQARALKHMSTDANSIVSHLGTDLVPATPDNLPANLAIDGPYFVCVGTIEPRKNHQFLLDVWDEMGADAPVLIIAGSRGWRNDAVFQRLDILPEDGAIKEVSGLSDGALAALIEGANAVVFPSHAEGYGLPAAEAVARGVPVIVNDLAVFREILGQKPVYANVSDRYLWINTIKKFTAAKPATSKREPFQSQTWDEHFKTVLRLT